MFTFFVFLLFIFLLLLLLIIFLCSAVLHEKTASFYKYFMENINPNIVRDHVMYLMISRKAYNNSAWLRASSIIRFTCTCNGKKFAEYIFNGGIFSI